MVWLSIYRLCHHAALPTRKEVEEANSASEEVVSLLEAWAGRLAVSTGSEGRRRQAASTGDPPPSSAAPAAHAPESCDQTDQ